MILATVARPALNTAAAREHGCEAAGDMARASEAPPLAAPPGADGDGHSANRGRAPRATEEGLHV